MKMEWWKRKSGRSRDQKEPAENLADLSAAQAASALQAVYDYLSALNGSGANQMGDRVL